MMDDFLQFLREPIAQRSLLACVMIGFANGFVSGLVILKKSALQIGTLSCALLPGIAVAVLLFGLTRWSLLTGAVVAALLVGLGSLFVSRTSRLNQDTALSILHTTAFAAGFIVLVRLGLQQKIDDWLFGSIMSLSDSDLWIAFAISSVSVLILLLFRRPILICLFDPDIATTLGIPSRLISYGIFTLIILVLVSSLQAVGAFLTLGLLVGRHGVPAYQQAGPSLLGGRNHRRAGFPAGFLPVLPSGLASGRHHHSGAGRHFLHSLFVFITVRAFETTRKEFFLSTITRPVFMTIHDTQTTSPPQGAPL